MDRLESVRKVIDAMLLNQPDVELRRTAYVHLYGVAQNCSMLAIKRGLDIELSAIMGMLHDIYTYKFHYIKEHAVLGATEAESLLQRLDIFTEEEIEIIKTAINNHSDKKTKHDPYSELLKDADVLQNSLYNTSFDIKHVKRLMKVFKSFGVKMKLKRIKEKKQKQE
jgi:uncharacterized protein